MGGCRRVVSRRSNEEDEDGEEDGEEDEENEEYDIEGCRRVSMEGVEGGKVDDRYNAREFSVVDLSWYRSTTSLLCNVTLMAEQTMARTKAKKALNGW